MHRFPLWTRCAAPIREAGLFGMTVGLTLGAWRRVSLGLLALGRVQAKQPAHDVRYLANWNFGLYLPPAAWLVWKSLARRSWALWRRSILCWGIPVSIAVAMPFALEIDRGGVFNAMALDIWIPSNVLITFLMSVPFFSDLPALRADHANPAAPAGPDRPRSERPHGPAVRKPSVCIQVHCGAARRWAAPLR